jgi:hypothetical protein
MAEKQTGYAMRFISGKYQGNEYPLHANREIVIGRGSELDIVLVEDMVSRRHAKIVTGEDYVILQDLGSTNGSFVNGERIRKTRLHEGDRILIGTSILKLVTFKGDDLEVPNYTPASQPAMPPPTYSPDVAAPLSIASHTHNKATMALSSFQSPVVSTAPPSTPQPNVVPHKPMSPAMTPAPTPPPSSQEYNQEYPEQHKSAGPDLGQASMSGNIQETPLSDLLELFATSRRNGVLVIQNEKEGRLHFRNGMIAYAIIDNNFTVTPHKSAFRILVWKQGTFQLFPPHDQDIHAEIKEEPTALLQKALQQHEQIKRYQNDLPSPIHNISIQRPLRSLLRDLRPEYLDTLQQIYNHGILDNILNKSNSSDLEIYQHLVFLYKHQYINVH